MRHAAIIGLTSWYSRSFAGALATLPDVQLAAGVDLGVDDATMQRQTGMSRQEYAARYDGLQLYRTTEDLLAAGPVDLAFICAPNTQKAAQGAMTIRAGIDTFFAKPMTASIEGVRQILDAANAHPAVWVGALNPSRFDGAIRAAYKQVQQDAIGDVLSARAWIQHGAWTPGHSRRGNPEMDDGQGGPAYSLGVYAADLLNWFIGAATPPQRAYAEYATLATPDYPFMDSGKGTVRYADGRLGSMDIYFATPCPAPQWEIEIAGRAGILRTTGAAYEGTIWHVDQPTARGFYHNQNDVIRDAVAHWVASCRDRNEPEMNLADACRAIQVCAAWAEAARTATPITLDVIV